MNLKKSLSILALAATAIVAAKAYAASSYYTVYTYYTDASYSTEVGTLTRACNGQYFRSGTTNTAFRLLTEREPCCGSLVC